MISVIIPSLNSAETILELLASVKEQLTDQKYEIILVDDDSHDNSQNMIKYMYPKVVVIQNQEQLGRPGSRNVGLQNMRGDLVLMMDSDIRLDKDCLKRLLVAYTRGDTDIVFPTIDYENGDRKHPLGNNSFSINTACFLADGDIFKDVQFDTNFMYLEDQDFSAQCELNDIDASWVQNARAIHRDNTIKTDNSYKFYQAMRDIPIGIRKYENIKLSFPTNYNWFDLFKGFVVAVFNFNYFCHTGLYRKGYPTLIYKMFTKHKKFEIGRWELIKLYFKAVLDGLTL